MSKANGSAPFDRWGGCRAVFWSQEGRWCVRLDPLRDLLPDAEQTISRRDTYQQDRAGAVRPGVPPTRLGIVRVASWERVR